MSRPFGRLARLAGGNPMVRKELRGRMRSGRSAVVLTVYLAVLALVTLLFYWIIYESSRFRNPYNQQVGRDLLSAVVVFETLLVIFLAPAFTAGVISGERERQTFDLLMTTLLTPRAVVLGKMGAALAFLLLIILTAVPLESLAFMMGGVAPEEILIALIVLLFAALFYGSVGICWSTLMRSTAASTVLSYATLLIMLVGIPFVWFVGTAVLSLGNNAVTNSVPFVYLTGLIISTDPILALGFSQAFVRAGHSPFFYVDRGLINGRSILVIQPWLVFCLLALAGSALLLAASVRFLPPVRPRRAVLRPTEPLGTLAEPLLPPGGLEPPANAQPATGEPASGEV